jgi:tetratricopeptide (TPR) repeat protein
MWNRVMLKKLLLALLLSLTILGSLYAAGEAEEDKGERSSDHDLDYLGIAALMLRDGNLGRASAALEKVDPDDPNIDRPRFHTLQGLVALRTNDPQSAVPSFERAIESGQKDPSIYAYLAQAYFLTEKYQEVIDAVAQMPSLRDFPNLYGLRAAAEWKLGNWEKAMATLDRAQLLFPGRVDFIRQKIGFLLELNLTQEAAAQSLAFLQNAPKEADVYLTIGEALRRGGELDAAVVVLEEARIRFPLHEGIRLVLAQSYLQKGMRRAAAAIIEEAAARNFSLYYEAAELFRQAGEIDRALYLNTQVLDQELKTRQRFNLLLTKARYEEAAALEPRLASLGLTEDENISYSLGYAFYRNGQYDKAVSYIGGISSPDLYRKSIKLRSLIEERRGQ